MKPLNPPSAAEKRPAHQSLPSGGLRGFCVVVFAVLFLSGCNSFGKGKLAEQLQNDNDRLLAEFRAQRDRNEELQQKNRHLEQRVAETEKLLARQYQAGSGRISSLNSSRTPALTPGLGSGPLSSPAPLGTYGNESGPGSSGLEWRPR